MPAKATTVEFRWNNGRGQEMQGAEFLPAGAPRGALVWNHGIAEHLGRYVPVFKLMADQGVAVYAYDMHGHGRSQPSEPGMRCFVDRFEHLVDDVYSFVAVIEQRRGARLEPCVMGGQSMGGLVAVHAVLRNQERWSGLALHSAALDVVWTPVLRFQAMLGGLLAMVLPKAQIVPAVNPEDLHPDPAVVEAFKADELVSHGNVRSRTANEVLKGMQALQPRLEELKLPLYIVHGTRDLTTSLAAVELLAARAASADVTFNKVEGGYHELLMGEERAANGAAMAEWVKQRCAAHAAGKPAAASPKL